MRWTPSEFPLAAFISTLRAEPCRTRNSDIRGWGRVRISLFCGRRSNKRTPLQGAAALLPCGNGSGAGGCRGGGGRSGTAPPPWREGLGRGGGGGDGGRGEVRKEGGEEGVEREGAAAFFLSRKTAPPLCAPGLLSRNSRFEELRGCAEQGPPAESARPRTVASPRPVPSFRWARRARGLLSAALRVPTGRGSGPAHWRCLDLYPPPQQRRSRPQALSGASQTCPCER